MIISRTPLRITLGGGGTDLPSYYEQLRGAGALGSDQPLRLHRHQSHVQRRLLPQVLGARAGADVDDIEHPIIREALRLHPIGPSIELVSVADIPAGTGLGSSGTFTVGLLKSLYAFKHRM